MRPSILFPLFATVQTLKGVGPRMAPLYKKLCGEHVVDLLWHLPSGVIDRSYRPKLIEAEAGRIATVTWLACESVKTNAVPLRGVAVPNKVAVAGGIL